MTPERLEALERNETDWLSEEERAAGWHFCPEMDDLIMGPATEGPSEPCICQTPGAKMPAVDYGDVGELPY